MRVPKSGASAVRLLAVAGRGASSIAGWSAAACSHGSFGAERVRRADLAIYHVGNNAMFHRDIYRLAVEQPGVVVLHDLALDDLIRSFVMDGDPLGKQALIEARASGGRVSREDAAGSQALAVPWCAHVVRRARGVIVHSEFGRRYLFAAGCRTPVYVAPHPVIESEEAIARAREDGRSLRADLERSHGVPRFEILVGVVGDLSSAKGIAAILEALPSIGAAVHLVLVGRTASGWDVMSAVKLRRHRNRVTVARNVSDRQFLAWLCACDIAVNLRHPHRGEVSGSLIRALQAGLPTVVSATGTYMEWPSDTVVRVSGGEPKAEDLAFVVSLLAMNPGLRTSVGERGRAFLLEHCSPAATAALYERAVNETLALMGDPLRHAVSRWAEGLAECGASAETARRGFGTRFAEELAILSGS